MPVAALAAALLLGLGTSQQTPQTATPLPDVEVTGRPTAEAVREFVGRVAAPARGRDLAKWRDPICPGIANLDPVAAQAINDRIAEVAAEVGVETGAPGCNPNLIVVFTEDGRGVAQGLVAANREVFRQNVSGQDGGTAAFNDFQNSDRAVRWWAQSIAVDSDTGVPAFRRPGDAASAVIDGDDDSPLGAAPHIAINAASRLNSQIIDTLFKTIVIVDVDQIGNANTAQLGDYIAFIGLAQIDATADTAGFDTVLNLFDSSAEGGLTEWDRSYLSALYAPRYGRASSGAQATAVANIMTRDRREAARSE